MCPGHDEVGPGFGVPRDPVGAEESVKRVFRGPWVWIVVAVLAVLLALEFLAPGGGYDEVSTSQMSKYIADGEVKEINFIDGDQTIEATLDSGTRDDGDKVMTHYIQGQQETILAAVDEQVAAGHHREVELREPPAQPARLDPRHAAAVRADHPAVHLPDEQRPGRRPGRDAVRQVQGQDDQQGHAEDHLRRRRRLRRGDRGARRDQGVPPGAGQVPGGRRQDPQGRAALRPSGHRQDPARPRRRRRGRRAVLLDLRLRLRRDVRRRGCLPRPRPLRAGEGERPGDRLHRRDRRRRPPPRRRHGRRSRRARADAQPAARRDGRLRRPRRRDPDRRDQPARRPRPGAAAPRSVRPPDRRRRARPGRPQADPRGALPGQAAEPRRRPDGGGASYPGLQRRRPGQRAQRGRAADRAQQPEADLRPARSTRRSTGSSPARSATPA